MAKTVTTTAVKRIIAKGLTGWQAGKLTLQDMVDSLFGRDSVLTEADMAAIQQARMERADVRDYNMFMALCRGFHMGYILAEWACKDACLQIVFLDQALKDAEKRRTVELFESFGPRVVTRMQYEEIVAAQRQKKLAFEYSLGYVIQERFHAIAPPEARTAMDESGADIKSMADFAMIVPDEYGDLCKQAIDEVHRLYVNDKLPAIWAEEDTTEIRALLRRWKKSGLASDEVMKLVDRLYATGQVLYDCQELPEWKSFIEEYQQHWLDDDERFRHAYAVLEDCPKVWLDPKGHYKGPMPPSQWITHGTESLLGLIGHDDESKKSVKRVGAELSDELDTAEKNIRMFLALRAVLDTAADAIELDTPSNAGLLVGPNMRLDAFIALYNLRLAKLKAEQKPWRPCETRLEQALKMLPAIDVDKLNPSPDSLRQLKRTILDNARGEQWLRAKIRSVECADGIGFTELMG